MDFGPFPARDPLDFAAASCVSVDFDVTEQSRFDDNRMGTMALLRLADRHEIPITWAMCGRSAEEDVNSYSAIVDSSTRHEIGVHTYSHLDATASTAEEFRADVQKCVQTLRVRSPQTFVFPWNREAHFDVLSELGFRVYRGANRAIGRPVQRGGLWNIRPVYYVDAKSEGAQSLMKSYVDLCIKRRSIFHLWLHPWSIMIRGRAEPMSDTLDEVFAYMHRKKTEGKMDLLTMGELANRLDQASGPGESPKAFPQVANPQSAS
ncbi:MAG: polysaccharide deacetylase family protein [Thaumarchaeota archaeon]|nr:polysaccharide deacetylase family protein [Nitrososphaerota archaeon]